MESTRRLELNRYQLASLHVERNTEVPAENPGSVSPVVNFDAYLHQTDFTRFMVVLEITSPEEVCPYTFNAGILGYFVVPEPFQEGRLNAERVVNGLTILYGLLRAHLATATGWFGSPLQLSTMYFSDLVAEKAAEARLIAERGEEDGEDAPAPMTPEHSLGS